MVGSSSMAGLQHAAGQFCDFFFQFFIGKGGGAASGILFVHPDFQLFHQCVMLAELPASPEVLLMATAAGRSSSFSVLKML